MAGRARGRLEAWQKWSFPVSPLRQDSGDPVGGGRYARGGGSAGSRWLASAPVVAPVPGLGQEPRCEVELTEVHTVAGEIDIATATRLRERLFELAAGGRPLVADLDQVRFIDSAGLSALVGAAKRAAAHGGSLHVVCARPQIRQLFRLTGLDRRLMPARTLDEALDALLAARTTPR